MGWYEKDTLKNGGGLTVWATTTGDISTGGNAEGTAINYPTATEYDDGSKMSNFTKYRIINYFTAWLLDNDYLSKEVTTTFEEL